MSSYTIILCHIHPPCHRDFYVLSQFQKLTVYCNRTAIFLILLNKKFVDTACTSDLEFAHCLVYYSVLSVAFQVQRSGCKDISGFQNHKQWKHIFFKDCFVTLPFTYRHYFNVWVRNLNDGFG